MDHTTGLQAGNNRTPARVQRATLAIEGLSNVRTGGVAVDEALRAVRGVLHVYVNPPIEMAYVEYDPCLCCPEHILSALQSAGYCGGELCLR